MGAGKKVKKLVLREGVKLADKVEVMLEPDIRAELELDQIGAPASDFKRAAILVHLVDQNREEKIPELKKHVEEKIGMAISDGTFRWHVERLRSANVIQINPASGTISPTESGRIVAEIIRPAFEKALSTISPE